MKYELTAFEALIEKAVETIVNANESNIIFAEFKHDLDEETENIRCRFIDVVFESKEEKHVEKYIQQHQVALIRIFDKLLKYLPSEYLKLHGKRKAKDTTIPCYIYSKIEYLLNYIEDYFSKYFCQDANIPNSYRMVEQLKFQRKIKELIGAKECKLIEIALSPVHKFIDQNKPVSYKELIYLKELLKIIGDTCFKCKDPKVNCKLENNLGYLNFNSYKFFSYLISDITKEYQKEASHAKKIERLSYCLKKTNQLFIKPGTSFKPGHKSIKKQIQNWIKEEIDFLEKNHQLAIEFPDNLTVQSETPISDVKVETGLTVSQFAYLIRLLVNTGVIAKMKNKELINFFSTHFQTPKAGAISPESFRSKYYGIDEKSKEFVKGVIIKLLNETSKNL